MAEINIPTIIPKGAKYALVLVALTNAISLLDRQILAILAPAIKQDLKIGDAEMGLLYGTVFALFYALFSLPLGRLADGWVRSRLLAVSIAFWSAATALGGMANGFAMLAISRLGVGIGEAAAQPAGTSLIYDYWPKQRRGFVMAVLASAIALGLGGSLVLGGVAAADWDAAFASGTAPFGLKGWQFAFLVASLPGFVLALFMWRLREPERGVMDGIQTPPDPAPFRASWNVLAAVTPGFNWLALGRRGASAGYWRFNLIMLVAIVLAMWGLVTLTSAWSPRPSLDFGAVSLNPHVLQWSVIGFGLFVIVNLMQNMAVTDAQAFRVITRSPTLLMVMAVGTLQSVLNYGMMSFNPSFLMKYYGLSLKDTALQFGLVSAGMGIVGPLFWGPFSDWLQKRFPGVGRAYVALFCMGLSPLISFWVYHAPDATGFYWRFVAYSIVLTGWLPPLYAIMYEQVLPRMRGTTSSVYLLVSTILGLGIGPYVVGVLSDASGNLRNSMLTINVVGIAIIVLMLLVARRAQRDENALMERAA
ncbi:MFS transporter [Novosphingobium sp.]|uniref:MFS transporter n=1 Tax=Novosphingobium sp. TaxID=1874826 RepID=UPI0027338ABC|nr:MFS transporter [Novosphingobium sp.]MDP3908490.1 MFS transporter [Novosphingobium sp.]